MRTITRTSNMTRQNKRTTGAGVAGIAVLLSAASVLAQGAGPMPRHDDDRGNQPDRGAPERMFERRVLKHDDVVPPPPQPDGEWVIERRVAPRGGQGGDREQGLSQRLEHRIRMLEERVRVLSDALRSRLREHGPAQGRGGNRQPGDEAHALLGRLHEGLLRQVIEGHMEGRNERQGGHGGPGGPGGHGSHDHGGPPQGPHGLGGHGMHNDDDRDDDDHDDARPGPGGHPGGHGHQLFLRLNQPQERDVQIERLDGPGGPGGQFRLALPRLGTGEPTHGRGPGGGDRDDDHDGPHFIGLNGGGTFQIEIKGLDGQGNFRRQIELSPPGASGPRGGGHPGMYPGGPGHDNQHEFIIELHNQDSQPGKPGPQHGGGPGKAGGGARGEDGPGANRRVIERRIIKDRDNDNGPGDGPRPPQLRMRMRMDDGQQDDSRHGAIRGFVIEEDSDRDTPPARPAPPKPPAPPRAPRGPAGQGGGQPDQDRAPVPPPDRGPGKRRPNVVPAVSEPDSDGVSYNYTVASLDLPPEGDAQPTPKPRAAARAKANVVVDSKNDAKSDQAVTIIEDDDAVTVRMENGKVASVERNGKKVPLDRIRQEEGKLKIVDENGKVVYEMELNAAPPPPPPPPVPPPAASSPVRARAVEGRLAKPDAAPPQPLPPGQVRIRGNKIENAPGGASGMTIAEPPKVIVGIQMAEPDRSLLGHFGLKPGEVTLISGIYADLPASQAGLDLYDIIVAVDGKSPASQDDVRKALRNKNDGDVATFTVIHKGQRKQVELKLIPFEANKLESSKLKAIPVETDLLQGMGGNGQFFVTPDGTQWQSTGVPVPEEHLDKIREYMDRAQNMSKDAEARANEATKRRIDRQREVRPEASRNGQPSAPRGEGSGERMQNLEERLDRLEKLLERLIEQRRGNDNPPPPGGGRGGPRTTGNES